MTRTAVLQEWYAPFGGSEQVARELSRVLDADLWCLWQEAADGTPAGLRESRLASLPAFLRERKLAMALTPWVWRHTSTPVYDLVVSSSHAQGHTALLPSSPDAVYLSYVHTPARYLWSVDLDPRGAAWYLGPARALLQRTDVRYARHVAGYAANSTEVRERIRRYWHQDAVVIPPPVDTGFFTPAPPTALPEGVPADGYLLAAGRWVSYKRFDLALLAADRAGLPMVVAGGGPEEAALREVAASVRVPVHWVPDPSRESLRELFRGATALLFPGWEDFGMVPVEAMACGTPVIALDAGGARETVVPGVSGALVAGAPEDFAAAVPGVAALDRDAVARSAERFSYRAFDERVRAWTGSFA